MTKMRDKVLKHFLRKERNEMALIEVVNVVKNHRPLPDAFLAIQSQCDIE